MATASTTAASAAAQRQSNIGRHLRHMNWLGGTFGWIWLLIVMIPLYWIVITSFKTQSNYFITNTFAPPTSPTLENYRLVIQNDFIRYFLNSVIVSVRPEILPETTATAPNSPSARAVERITP